MGYSNVAGDLNVYGTSTLSTLVVNGSTFHYGPITSTSNAAFSNLVANNLTVTGNFIINSTNTQISNALSIVNQGSATALYVNQNESVAHTHNSLEVWDHTTLAMVVDPNGNVCIHTFPSPNFALTVVQGASIDQLTIGTPLSISSGGTGTATGATQNYVFAGPSIGSAGAPSFRALVNADLPSVISVSNVSANGSGLYSLNSSNLVGNVANANVALVVSQAAQPNITSVGLLSNLAVSNSVTVANLVAGGYVVTPLANVGTLNVLTVSNLSSLTANLIATTANVGTLNVLTVSNLSSLTANLVAGGYVVTPLANVGTLNVLTISNLNSLTTNLVAGSYVVTPLANVGTLNVLTIANLSSLTTNLVAGGYVVTPLANVGTLNVIAISNLNSLQLANALQTTNVSASGNVVIGPTPTAIQANLHVEQGNLFIGNSAVVGSNSTTSGPTNLLIFDNTSNSTTIPNKIVLFSNGTVTVGSGVFGVGPTGASVAYYTKDSHYFYAGFTTAPYCVGGFTGSSTFTVGSTPNSTNAKLWVTGGAPSSNIMARIDASNIALTTSGAGLVGFGILAPTANLHVVGNVYASNALQTPSVIATTANVGTLNVISISNLATLSVGLYIGNASGLSNITGSNVTGNVASANVALVVAQASQPNITSVGILSNLVVANSLTTTNVYLTGTLNLIGTANISNIITQNVTAFGTSLVVTGVTVNGNVYVSNTSTAANGFYSTGSFGGSFTDGIVMDYLQGAIGNGRLSVGTNDGITLYSGGLAAIPLAYFSPNIQVGLGTTSPSSNLQVVGNVYASNALTTTNIFTAGFTSNATNTIFNYDTITIPFVYSTTQNVSGTSNVLVQSITGSSGQTSLYVSGNVYVSNAITATNVFGTSVSATLYGPVTGSNIGAFSNLYSANALVTTNVFATLFGPVAGANTGAFSNLYSANALVTTNVVATNVFATMYGPVAGSNIGAFSNLYSANSLVTTNVVATSLTGTFYGPLAGSNTVSASSVSATTLYGTLAGSNTVSATTLYGTLAGSNTVSASSVYGPIAGSNTGAFSNLYSANSLVTTNVVATSVSATLYGTLAGSNTVSASSVSATSVSATTLYGTLAGSNTVSATTLYGAIAGSNTGAFSNLYSANALVTTNVSATSVQTTSANVGTLNVITISNLISLTTNLVSVQSNILTANIGTVQTTNLIPVTTGLFMNLNATYTLNSTGNWTGNIAGTITSNLYTLFSPNPVANWTKVGSNPFIVGPNASGSFQFLQPGPYVFTCVISADNDIKTIALSSNTADVHSNLANPGVWLYCYRVSVGMNPSYPVTLPVNVTNTSLYYWIDIETVNQSDNIHRTAYTNVTSEAYTGSYVLVRPL